MKKYITTVLTFAFLALFTLTQSATAQSYGNHTEFAVYTSLEPQSGDTWSFGGKLAGLSNDFGAYGRLGYRVSEDEGDVFEAFEVVLGPSVMLLEPDDGEMAVGLEAGYGVVTYLDVTELDGTTDNTVNGVVEASLNIYEGHGVISFGGRYMVGDFQNGFEPMFTLGVVF